MRSCYSKKSTKQIPTHSRIDCRHQNELRHRFDYRIAHLEVGSNPLRQSFQSWINSRVWKHKQSEIALHQWTLLLRVAASWVIPSDRHWMRLFFTNTTVFYSTWFRLCFFLIFLFVQTITLSLNIVAAVLKLEEKWKERYFFFQHHTWSRAPSLSFGWIHRERINEQFQFTKCTFIYEISIYLKSHCFLSISYIASASVRFYSHYNRTVRNTYVQKLFTTYTLSQSINFNIQ